MGQTQGKYSYEEVQKYISMKNKIKYEQEHKLRLAQEKKMKEFQEEMMKRELEKKQQENFNEVISNLEFEQNQSILGDVNDEQFFNITRNVTRVKQKNNKQHYVNNDGNINYNPYPVINEEFEDDEIDEDILIVEIQGKKYNSMKILGLDLNTDNKQLKRKYHKLAQKFHPDKGGNPRKFMIIHRCYEHLNKLLASEQSTHSMMKQDTDNYISQQINKELVNEAFGKGKHFNQKKFNQMFENTRIANPYDKGYGDMINQEYNVNDETIKRDHSLGNPTSLNRNQFERKFNKQKERYQKKMPTNQLQVYQGLNTNIKGLGFQELGQNEIDDFTSGENDPLNFTDYKKAYRESSVLINPNNVQQRKSYKNIEQYKNARSDLKLTPLEQEKIAKLEILKKQKEKKRRHLLRQQDKIEAHKYNYLNKILIKNGKN